jgi:hypothetical protein
MLSWGLPIIQDAHRASADRVRDEAKMIEAWAPAAMKSAAAAF